MKGLEGCFSGESLFMLPIRRPAGQYHCVCIHCAGKILAIDTAKYQPDLPEGSFPVRQPTVNQYRTD